MKKIVQIMMAMTILLTVLTANVCAVEIEPRIIAKMQELKSTNEELTEYVDQLEEHYGKDYEIDLTEESKMEDVPLLIQWDKRWGYKEYGSGLIGYTACGPTCLAMVALYFTDNPEYTPIYMSQYALDHGYYIYGAGTAWALFETGSQDFGLTCQNLAYNESNMKEHLDQGELLICSMRPGDFTTGGHFLIVKGYNEEGFIINDPNSKIKSGKVWAPDIFIPQVKQMWGFRKSE